MADKKYDVSEMFAVWDKSIKALPGPDHAALDQVASHYIADLGRWNIPATQETAAVLGYAIALITTQVMKVIQSCGGYANDDVCDACLYNALQTLTDVLRGLSATAFTLHGGVVSDTDLPPLLTTDDTI